jgi:hypothetical protein
MEETDRVDNGWKFVQAHTNMKQYMEHTFSENICNVKIKLAIMHNCEKRYY